MPTIEDRLRQWQQELLDFSNRNHLLNFRWSTSKPSSIELIAPDAITLYQTLLDGRSLLVLGVDPPNDEDEEDQSGDETDSPDQLDRDPVEDYVANQPRVGTTLSRLPTERTNRVLLRLMTRARASEQELGINTLFAAFGLLKWQEKAGSNSWQYAPLVMLPLTIEERTREGSFRITSAGEDVEFNQTIVERLKRDFGLDIAVDIDEEMELATVFREVRVAISKKPGWDILEQVHLGHFQFYKLRMFEDLAEHAALAAEHAIVQALGSDVATIAPLPDGLPSEEELDHLPPGDSFTILDSDASQQIAVQAAVRGAHLIVQGPPGTGKSQTIANIIAECIAAGRTVLFVSEKAAAIDVVHRRLSARGLDEFCLMLHSHKANKREIIAELGARLEIAPSPPASSQERLALERLQEHRVALDSYAEALHRPREPLQESVFWVHGELARLQHVPLISVSTSTGASLTHDDLDRSIALLDEVAAQALVLQEGSEHPWAGAQITPPSLAQRGLLRDLLTSLLSTIESVQHAGEILASRLQLPILSTISSMRDLDSIAGCIQGSGLLRTTWFDGRRAQDVASFVAEAKGHSTSLHEIETRLSAVYEPSFLEIDPDEAIASYAQSVLTRLFSSSHRALKARARVSTRSGQKRSESKELASFREARTRRQLLAWFEEHQAATIDLLGLDALEAAKLNVNEWEQIESSVAMASDIIERFASSPIPAAFVVQACRPEAIDLVSEPRQQLKRAIETFNQQMGSLSAYFEDGAFPPALQGNIEDLRQLLSRRKTRLDDLDRWVQAQLALRRANDAGLSPVMQALFTQDVPAPLWSKTYRRLALTSWHDAVVRDDPTLQSFDGSQHDRRVAQFDELDRNYLRNSNHRARRARLERQVRVTAAYGGEPQVLRFEAQKRRRHMPLRRLFERIPNLLPTLKPCLMMSPLSVAQFLPADLYHFDIVIFDEASQVRPHDAIGAIMRGKQLIVAGDSKQLPPTSFFDRVIEDGDFDEDQDIRSLESILDVLNAKGMPEMRLLWHYRSRHEDLIAYSNHHFYDGRLITFPSPSAERSLESGVRLEFVPDGKYVDERDRILKTPLRVNRSEAKRVARLVMEHARTRPDESLLVVTLGMNQRDVVEEEIKLARQIDRSLEAFFDKDKLEPFDVKPLEQVQGDERDVILISVGYGKNAEGVLSHNFGPINQQGGERRLNVLVTRARKQVVLVSSIRFMDIDPARTQNHGPRLLRNYLEFAEHGAEVLTRKLVPVGDDGEYESPFEEEVGEALKRAGLAIRRQVGSSKYRIDMAIIDPRSPDRYILGIECDGKTYHQSKTARDRDRLRQEVLEHLGWTIHRIWSTEWLQHPERELERVIARINALVAKSPDGSDRPSANGPNPLLAPDDAQISVNESLRQSEGTTWTTSDVAPESLGIENEIAVPYRMAEFQLPDEELWDTPISRLADAIVACVDIEGPIHHDLLLRRITNSWGYQRAGSRIARHVDQAISFAIRRERIRRAGAFLWPNRALNIVPRGPASDGSLREIGHIPDEEIGQAVTAILDRAFSLSPEDLVVQSARVFGFQRTGADIRARVLSVARTLYKKGNVEFKGGRVQLERL